jgi:hypothetical protein
MAEPKKCQRRASPGADCGTDCPDEEFRLRYAKDLIKLVSNKLVFIR